MSIEVILIEIINVEDVSTFDFDSVLALRICLLVPLNHRSTHPRLFVLGEFLYVDTKSPARIVLNRKEGCLN